MSTKGKSGYFRAGALCSSTVVCFVVGILSVGEVKADSWGGSWGGSSGGSSGGSWGGSNGSYGSSGGGLLGGRRPIRNLLGRMHDRFHGGSHGGSSGSNGSWGGSTGYTYASSGSHGSHGSTGYSYASTGMGSSGSSYGSMGSSYGSVGSSYGSSGGYGSVGMSYGSGMPVTGYDAYSAPMSNGQVIYDSGYSPSVSPSIDSSMAPSLNPLPGVYYEGGIGSPSPTPTSPSSVTPGSGGSQTAPNPPASTDGSTGIVPERATVLSLKVPRDAQVYINDHKTRTQGDMRRYVSRNLDQGREYFYHVKAVVVRNGKEIERNELVSLKAGQAEVVEFDFEQSVTALALKVPANAKVTLCGKTTNASGTARHFSTSKLEPGQVWNDYTVEVAVETNGRTIRQEKKLQLVGGETYKLSFEFDETTGLLAVR